MINKFADKLDHLTPDQVNEVMELFADPSIKVKEILEAYNIDVSACYLGRILPPIKTDKVCEYCGQPMYYQPSGRENFIAFKQDSDIKVDLFCKNCNHHVYKYLSRKCTCENCTQKTQKLIQKAAEERALQQQQKIQLIQDVYGKTYPILQFEELSPVGRFKLVYVLQNSPAVVDTNGDSFSIVINPIENEAVFVNDNILSDFIVDLVGDHIISISPQSSIDAFEKENFPHTGFVKKLQYTVNIKVDSAFLLRLRTNSCFNISDKIMLMDTYKATIYYDLMCKFNQMLQKRNLTLYISDDADAKFKSLLDKLSYSQILYLCNKVAMYFSDKVLTGCMTHDFASKVVLMNVSKFYERSISSGWEIYRRNVDVNSLNHDLYFFIDTVFNLPISILDEIASVENLKKWEEKYHSSDNSSSDSNTSVEPSASAENEKSTVLDGEIDTELRRQYNGK